MYNSIDSSEGLEDVPISTDDGVPWWAKRDDQSQSETQPLINPTNIQEEIGLKKRLDFVKHFRCTIHKR